MEKIIERYFYKFDLRENEINSRYKRKFSDLQQNKYRLELKLLKELKTFLKKRSEELKNEISN